MQTIEDIINLAKKSYNLKTLQRFNDMPRALSESVAEHSFFVVLISRLLCGCFVDRYSLDVQKVTDMAIIHDLSEINLGDISHRVKVENPKFKAVLEALEKEQIVRLLSNKYYEKCLSEFIECSTYESIIVNLADVISVIIYAQNNMMLGNKNMINILQGAIDRANILLEQLESPYRFNFDQESSSKNWELFK
jgi:5'-deoxynucleotidase YfbR-like HD superfamily hydrolase